MWQNFHSRHDTIATSKRQGRSCKKKSERSLMVKPASRPFSREHNRLSKRALDWVAEKQGSLTEGLNMKERGALLRVKSDM
ncbi:MAG: hypothetical protein MRK02_03175 [Candidatus Scalindua sp.]|nr:hypothetical protein [Candidatus Scalindua sp.]